MKKKEEDKSVDVLIQNEISVPVVDSFAQMSMNAHGICLCSTADAKRGLETLWGDETAAVLAPSNIDGQGTEMDVLVKDRGARMQRRPRLIFQLGHGAVEFKSSVPNRSVSQDSVRMMASMHEDSPSTWKSIMKNPTVALRQGLQTHVGTGILETRPPTRRAGMPGVQIMIYVSKATYFFEAFSIIWICL